ncbi:hypothetical protein ACW7BC_05605 [Azospirillum argentinense]
MSIVKGIITVYESYKKGKKIVKSAQLAHDTTIIVRDYITKDQKLTEIVLSKVEAWTIFFVFFGERMMKVKPSSLKDSDCADAQKILIWAWDAYHSLGAISEIGKKFITPPSKLDPLGLSHLLVKVIGHYIDAQHAPTRSEIDIFDRNGGVVKDQVVRYWRSHVEVRFGVFANDW